MGATYLAGYDISALKWYFICILVQIAAFFLTKDKPAFTLSVFGILGLISIIIALNTTGLVAVYALEASPMVLDHVALHLLSRNRWTGKVHHAGICIPRHDDSRRCHHPSHSRETCRPRIRGNSELFCGRRTLLCVSRLLRLVCKTLAQQTRANI